MAKKKFNETAVGKFLLDKIPNVVSGLVGGTPAGSLVRSLIGGSDMSQHDKEIAIKKLEQEASKVKNRPLYRGAYDKIQSEYDKYKD